MVIVGLATVALDRVRRHLAVVLFVALAAAPLPLCLSAPRSVPLYENGLRDVIDERGHRIAVPRAIRSTAVFMAIGVGEYAIVSRRPGAIITSDTPINNRIKTTPLLVKSFPNISNMRTPMSSAETGSINAEVLLREKPDVLVTWARLAEGFERLGLPVIGLGAVNMPQRLEENTRLFSMLVDEPERAERIIERSNAELSRIKTASEEIGGERTPVLMLFSLAEGQWRIGYGFPTLFDLARARNLGIGFPPMAINAEALLKLAPELILIIGAAGLDDDAPARLMSTLALRPLPAVLHRRVYETPPGVTGYMGTVAELPIYAQWLKEVVHPEHPNPEHAGARELAIRIYSRELGVHPSETDLDAALAVPANRHSAFSPAARDP